MGYRHARSWVLTVLVIGLAATGFACDGPTGPQGENGMSGMASGAAIERVFIRLENGTGWVSEGATWYLKLDIPSITPAVVDSGFVMVEGDGMPLPSTRRFFQEHGENLALSYTYTAHELVLWGTWRDASLSTLPAVEVIIVTTFAPATHSTM